MTATLLNFNSHKTERDLQERIEWAEQEASKYFVMATVRAHDDFNVAMEAARGCAGPAWERRRAAAKAKFQEATKEAHDLCERTEDWFTRHAEMSDELDNLWTDLINRDRVSHMMAAE